MAIVWLLQSWQWMPAGNTVLLPTLSAYHIFEGTPADLHPTKDYVPYELASALFTDYAEKQRLIKVPAGYRLSPMGSGLPGFPDGSMLVKTFFYYLDKRDTAKGKRLVETRVLIKTAGGWEAGTYRWNAAQTDAVLISGGAREPLQWTDAGGRQQTVNYEIPRQRSCKLCHQVNNALLPVGPRLRNLNRSVQHNGQAVNQLQYFYRAGLLPATDSAAITALPAWDDDHYPLAARARAYLELNCALCHRSGAWAARTGVQFSWELPLAATHIQKHGSSIIHKMAHGKMPKTGTTVVHTAGLELVRSYISSLQ